MNAHSYRRRLLGAFPFLSWFEDYRFTSLRSDMLAGLTITSILIGPSAALYETINHEPWRQKSVIRYTGKTSRRLCHDI